MHALAFASLFPGVPLNLSREIRVAVAAPTRPEAAVHPTAQPVASSPVAEVRGRGLNPATPVVQAEPAGSSTTAANDRLVASPLAALNFGRTGDVSASTNHAPATAAGTPSLPHTSAALLDLAAADPSLYAATLGQSAHVRLDAGSAGELTLHLRMRDGVADVRVDGVAAETIDIQAHELRTALAGEGIELGHFESAATRDGGNTASSPIETHPPSGESSPIARTADGTGPDGAGASDQTGMGSGAGSTPGFGSQSRGQHDRWEPDDHTAHRTRVAPPTPGSSPSSPDQPPRERRGLHVKA